MWSFQWYNTHNLLKGTVPPDWEYFSLVESSSPQLKTAADSYKADVII